MPKQAVNPRRFSNAELDPSAPLTVYLMLRPRHGSEQTCMERLRSVTGKHPAVAVRIAGFAGVGRQSHITLAIELGTAGEAMHEHPDALAALGLLEVLSTALYDYFPRLAAEPLGADAHDAARKVAAFDTRINDALASQAQTVDRARTDKAVRPLKAVSALVAA